MDRSRRNLILNGVTAAGGVAAVILTYLYLRVKPAPPPPPTTKTMKTQMILASDTEAGAATSAEYHLKKMGKAPLAVRAIPPNLGKFGLGQSTIGPESSGWLWNIEYDVPA